MTDTNSTETPKEESPKKETPKESKPKITSHVKEKDPKRVEAGRRLGAISKAAKERKVQERLRAQQSRKHSVEITKDEEVISKSEEMDHTMLYLTIAGVIIGAVGLYFTWKSEHKEHHKKKDIPEPQTQEEERSNRQSRSIPSPPQCNPYLQKF